MTSLRLKMFGGWRKPSPIGSASPTGTCHLQMTARLTNDAPPRIAGVSVQGVQSNDGIKYLMADGGWLLIRPSGTEPMLRVYAEAPEMHMADALLEYGQLAAGTSGTK